MYEKMVELGQVAKKYNNNFNIWGTILDKYLDIHPNLENEHIKLINRSGESRIHFLVDWKDLSHSLVNKIIEFTSIKGFGVDLKCKYRKSISHLQIYFNNNQFVIALMDEKKRNPRFVTKVSESDSLEFKIEEKILELKLKMDICEIVQELDIPIDLNNNFIRGRIVFEGDKLGFEEFKNRRYDIVIITQKDVEDDVSLSDLDLGDNQLLGLTIFKDDGIVVVYEFIYYNLKNICNIFPNKLDNIKLSSDICHGVREEQGDHPLWYFRSYSCTCCEQKYELGYSEWGSSYRGEWLTGYEDYGPGYCQKCGLSYLDYNTEKYKSIFDILFKMILNNYIIIEYDVVYVLKTIDEKFIKQHFDKIVKIEK